MPGTIIEQTGPVSYRVQACDQIWRRHTNQLLDCSAVLTDDYSDCAGWWVTWSTLHNSEPVTKLTEITGTDSDPPEMC